MNRYVILCPNPYRDAGLQVTLQAREILEQSGCEVLISPVFEPDQTVDLPAGVALTPMEEAVGKAQLLVTLGGDGTILRVARAATGSGVPILGVNLGTKGFMAELERTELDKLPEAAAGRYRVTRRMMLDIELRRAGAVVYRDSALNDAVVTGVVHVIHFVARGDGQIITEYSGDGMIAATPTGSTAYSMSAGGPLVEPEAENIILTPVCPHALAARSFVLAPERVVEIEASNLLGRQAVLSVDGGELISLENGDSVRVKKSRYQTLMAHMGHKSFYDIAYEKLGERT